MTKRIRTAWVIVALLGVSFIITRYSVIVATGTTYYFSTCPGPGGDGSISNPWCEIPTGQTTQKSVALLTDGINSPPGNPEFVAGDTALLCDGDCDGVGSWGRIHVVGTVKGDADCDNNVAWLSPRMDGTSLAPITIAPYCNADGSCEDVVVTGDADGGLDFDGDPDGGGPLLGEPNSMFMNAGSGSGRDNVSWWQIDGDPAGTGTYHLWFDDWGAATGNNWFNATCTYTGGGEGGVGSPQEIDGVANVTLRYVKVSGFGTQMYSGNLDLFEAGCAAGPAGYLLRVSNAGGPVVFDHITGDHICGMLTRWNFNPNALADLQLTNSTFANFYCASNDHNFPNGRLAAGVPADGHTTYSGDSFRGYLCGLSAENSAANWTARNNDFYCDGTHTDTYNGKWACLNAIEVNDGDTPMCGHCTNGGNNASNVACASDAICVSTYGGGYYCPKCLGHDFLIEGNRIHGDGTGQNAGGYLMGGINFSATYLVNQPFPGNVVIQNNLIWHQIGPFSGAQYSRAGINISSASGAGIILQGNSVYDSLYPLWVEKSPVTVRNNIFAVGQLKTGQVAWFDSAAAASSILNNDFYTGGTGTAVSVGATLYSCAGIDGIHASNNCLLPNFMDVLSADFTRWNLHIRYPSPGVIGAGSSAGPTTDIDGTTRPLNGSYEIGADETPFSAIDFDQQAPPGPAAPVIIRGKVRVP